MGTEYRVRDGDTWRTVARTAKVPVWELIKFNCRTTDPAEVNWWLHEVIGCDTCTADERNWMFSSGPGVKPIYLPPPSSLKMDRDARARFVELTIFDGKTKLGILTLEELCTEVGDPLTSSRARYSQVVPPASSEAGRALWVSSWAFGPLPEQAPEVMFGSASGYTLDSFRGYPGSYLSGLDYPLYAHKVHGSTGYLHLAVDRTVMNEADLEYYRKWKSIYDIEAKYSETFRKEFSEPKPVEPRYYTRYETFRWEATVTGWATAPPAGFILPD
jgi:hypothetical protein